MILEKGADVGGVWYWNHYPGLTCDVPSQMYQFGFAPKPDWSRVWATGPEIQSYHRDVVDRLGLAAKIQCNTEVLAAEYDEAEDGTGTWTLTLSTGATMVADFVLCATGVLENPAIPDIPGLAEFDGPVVHTARWDDSLVTTGKKIAVIGTGSTGVQVVSALQPVEEHVTHFMRSPQWVLWAPMWLPQIAPISGLLRRTPKLHDQMYRVLVRVSDILADIVTKPSWRRRAVQAYARLSLRAQVPEAMRGDLTPDYEPLCKRQVVSGTYYKALRAPNTSLVTAGISEITPNGVRTTDGREHPADILVLATGFRAHDYMRPMQITGRDGIKLDDAWADGPRAYRMTAIPGFPNLFTVLGPNSPTASILSQFASQLTANYIAHWLEQFRAGELQTVEVTEEATAEFNRQVAEAMGPTVWNTGCNSYYLTDSGVVDLWPFDRQTMVRMLSTPDDGDYLVRTRAATRPRD